jgi:tetrapyrrole methylase family protein/MazG family protein
MPAQTAALTIVGLGPGDASLLTAEAHDVLAAAGEVWLRTGRHPTVGALPPGPRYASFDELYERADSFDAVYEAIVARVFDLASRPEGVVYAVPGHPLFGEATVRELLVRCASAGPGVRIVSGISFLDTILPALGVDALQDGLLVIDALALGPGRRLLVPQRPAVIAQVYDRRTASAVKLALLEVYPAGHEVSIVRAAGGRDGSVTRTTVERLDRDSAFEHLTSLFVPPLPLTQDTRSFEGLRAVVARLRDPACGCPWDLEQTHASLKRFLIEEAYEALEALEQGDEHRLAEELGDLLMQVVLHAQLGEDNGTFVIEDVIGSIAAKLVRRHPHVFGDVEVSGADEVLRNWETLKSEERQGAPVLDAVPAALPALAQAQSVQSRAAKAQLGTPSPSAKEIEGLLRGAASAGAADDAFGDLLFGIVALAREHGVDAEEALRGAIGRFRARAGAEERERSSAT